MLLSLMIFATGCTTTPNPVVRTETIYQSPPAVLYPDCEAPEHTITTNGDLARAYRDLRMILNQCEDGLEQLRAWPDEDESL